MEETLPFPEGPHWSQNTFKVYPSPLFLTLLKFKCAYHSSQPHLWYKNITSWGTPKWRQNVLQALLWQLFKEKSKAMVKIQQTTALVEQEEVFSLLRNAEGLLKPLLTTKMEVGRSRRKSLFCFLTLKGEVLGGSCHCCDTRLHETPTQD